MNDPTYKPDLKSRSKQDDAAKMHKLVEDEYIQADKLAQPKSDHNKNNNAHNRNNVESTHICFEHGQFDLNINKCICQKE